jgi:hypothetical protein
MRTSTGGEDTVLAGTQRKTYYRVDIADASGTMQDFYNVGSLGWLRDFTIDEGIDEPVAGMTVTLNREARISGGYSSLSPLRTDSPVNVSGAAVDVYRRVKAYIATVTGARPTALSTDWKLKFDGVTDRVSMPDDDTEVLTCRDKGAYLIDQWIPYGETRDVIQLYFNGRAQPLSSVINSLLLYAPISGVAETVYVPTDPGYTVTSFPMKFESVMSAIQRAAALAVCDFRFAWHEASGTYKPTLFVPDRAPSGTSTTFASSGIKGWQRFDRDRLGVRNHIIVSYRPSNSTSRRTAEVSDATSIVDFGHRMLAIQEADDSAIDSSSEATAMANLILADVKDPKAEGEVQLLADWRVELNDYDTFADNKYFDIAQDLAIVGIKHVMQPNSQCTYLTVRGTPSAGYRRWIERAKDLDPEHLTPADNGLSEVQFTDDDAAGDRGQRTYTFTRGANVAFVVGYENLVVAPLTESAWPAAGDVLSIDGHVFLDSSTDQWVADKPPRGSQRFIILVPYYKLGGRYVQGDALKLVVDPLPSNMAVQMSVGNDPNTDYVVNNVVLVWGSQSDFPITVEVWQGPEDGDPVYSEVHGSVGAVGPASLAALPLLYEQQRSWSIKMTNVGGEVIRSSFTEPYRGYILVSTAVSMDATTATITVTVTDPWLFRQTFGGVDLSTSMIVDDIAYSDGSPGVTSDADLLNPTYTFVFVIGRDLSADFQVTGSVSLNLKSQYDPTWTVLDFGPAIIIPPALVPRQ